MMIYDVIPKFFRDLVNLGFYSYEFILNLIGISNITEFILPRHSMSNIFEEEFKNNYKYDSKKKCY